MKVPAVMPVLTGAAVGVLVASLRDAVCWGVTHAVESGQVSVSEAQQAVDILLGELALGLGRGTMGSN